MAQVSARFGNLGTDGAPARLGVMGGTFDPVHLGHLAAAEGVRRACRLDGVLFIPACTPVYKRGSVVASPEDRLAMCRLAALGNPAFDVSALEIERGGDTYTVDTLQALRAHYPSSVELYLILGTDAAETLWKWRDAADLAKLARIVIAARPGYELSEADRARIIRTGFADPLVVSCFAVDVSSSAVRAAAEQGDVPRYLVPESVRDYIRARGLYRAAGSAEAPASDSLEDPLSEAFLKARHRELANRVKPKRLRHCEGVSKTAVELAKVYGADVPRARLAGLLHDWDKGYDDVGIRQRARELGITVDPYVFENMPQVMHGPTAAAALGKRFPGIPVDVLNAIERHTSGAIGMSDLDMIVYIADGIEPTRSFPGVDDLRALVGKVGLEELFLEVFRGTFMGLLDRCRPVHPGTETVWNYYAARSRERVQAKKKRRKGNQ